VIEFADIYAYDLSTVILAGPTVLLVAFALAAAWMNRVPSHIRACDPAPKALRLADFQPL
jgi:hypothetical protein